MSLLWACEWLASTSGSIALHESQYMYTIVESVHVLTLCIFVGFAVLFDLRLLNKALTQVPVSEVSRRLLPWTVGGFVIMVLTGAALFYAIPVRTYLSIWFRFKLVFLILAGLNVLIFNSGVYARSSADGKIWPLVRLAPFPIASSYQVGPMACTPERAGLEVVFSDLSITAPLGKDLHDLS